MAKIADAPEWLLARCTPVRKPGEARPASEWVAMLREPALEGHRHETLLRVAGLLLAPARRDGRRGSRPSVE